MAGDVDTGTVVGKRGSNDKADTCATTGDYADSALDIEEANEGKLGVLRIHCDGLGKRRRGKAESDDTCAEPGRHC